MQAKLFAFLQALLVTQYRRESEMECHEFGQQAMEFSRAMASAKGTLLLRSLAKEGLELG